MRQKKKMKPFKTISFKHWWNVVPLGVRESLIRDYNNDFITERRLHVTHAYQSYSELPTTARKELKTFWLVYGVKVI